METHPIEEQCDVYQVLSEIKSSLFPLLILSYVSLLPLSIETSYFKITVSLLPTLGKKIIYKDVDSNIDKWLVLTDQK
jgi:hypothetical protein